MVREGPDGTIVAGDTEEHVLCGPANETNTTLLEEPRLDEAALNKRALIEGMELYSFASPTIR